MSPARPVIQLAGSYSKLMRPALTSTDWAATIAQYQPCAKSAPPPFAVLASPHAARGFEPFAPVVWVTFSRQHAYSTVCHAGESTTALRSTARILEHRGFTVTILDFDAAVVLVGLIPSPSMFVHAALVGRRIKADVGQVFLDFVGAFYAHPPVRVLVRAMYHSHGRHRIPTPFPPQAI